MCGIAGIHVKERYIGQLPLDDMADFLLLNIEDRGRHASGIASVSPGGKKLLVHKQPLKARDYILQRPDIPEDARTVLLHTRWATQGAPEVNENNHPVNWGSCFVVHNGHINNDWEIFSDLDETRTADVDSQAIAAVLSCETMRDTGTTKSALEKLAGSMAIAAIDPVNNPDQLLLARGSSSPLWVLNHRTCLIWASTRDAIEDMWGVLIGTPPQKRNHGRELDRIEYGLRDFYYGEMWRVNGDEIEQSYFTPKVSNWGYTYGGQSYSGSYGSTRASRWTCSPGFGDCDHKCENGCLTNRCTCVEYYDINDESGWETIHHGAKTKCESCWEWFEIDEITDYHVGTTSYALCDTCGKEWNIQAWADDPENRFAEITQEVLDSVEDSGESCGVQVFDRDGDEPEGDKSLRVGENANSIKAFEGAADIFERVHDRTCKKVAEDYGTTPAFVEWLMFKATPTTLANEFLKNTRSLLEKVYDREYQIQNEILVESGEK